MTNRTVPLPRVFAVQRGLRDAFLFEARHLDGHDHRHYWAGGAGPDEYEVRPQRSPDERWAVGAVTPHRIAHEGGGRVRMIIVEEPDDRRRDDDWHYNTRIINHYIPMRRDVTVRWNTTGRAIHLMTSPHPIPIVDVDADLPCNEFNRVRVYPAHPRDLTFWQEHWHPERLENGGDSDTDSEEEERRRQRRAARRAAREAAAAAAAAAAAPPPPAPSPAAPAPVPKFVADALIRDAITAAATCPITMEPLKTDTTAVTACFHLFERDAIAAWMVQSGGCCAVCKQRTAVTV